MSTERRWSNEVDEPKPHVLRAAAVVALLVVVVAGLVSIALLALVALFGDADWSYGTVRVIVLPFALLVTYGVRVAPRWLADRARAQGRDGDAVSYERATRLVYAVFGVVLAIGVVFVLLEQFPARDVVKILLLPPVVVGGLFFGLMQVGMADTHKGRAIPILLATGVLTWLILRL